MNTEKKAYISVIEKPSGEYEAVFHTEPAPSPGDYDQIVFTVEEKWESSTVVAKLKEKARNRAQECGLNPKSIMYL